MASVHYSLFENTAIDMRESADKLENYVFEDSLQDLSSEEEKAMHILAGQARRFLRTYDALVN